MELRTVFTVISRRSDLWHYLLYNSNDIIAAPVNWRRLARAIPRFSGNPFPFWWLWLREAKPPIRLDLLELFLITRAILARYQTQRAPDSTRAKTIFSTSLTFKHKQYNRNWLFFLNLFYTNGFKLRWNSAVRWTLWLSWSVMTSNPPTRLLVTPRSKANMSKLFGKSTLHCSKIAAKTGAFRSLCSPNQSVKCREGYCQVFPAQSWAQRDTAGQAINSKRNRVFTRHSPMATLSWKVGPFFLINLYHMPASVYFVHPLETEKGNAFWPKKLLVWHLTCINRLCKADDISCFMSMQEVATQKNVRPHLPLSGHSAAPLPASHPQDVIIFGGWEIPSSKPEIIYHCDSLLLEISVFIAGMTGRIIQGYI